MCYGATWRVERGGLTAAKICGEDVLSSDQQLFAQVSGLRRTVRQQLQHPFHHLLRILPNQILTKCAHTHNNSVITQREVNVNTF